MNYAYLEFVKIQVKGMQCIIGGDMNEYKKRIIFCLEEPSEVPIGGYKVIFEYANRLAADGYRITILFRYQVKTIMGITSKWLTIFRYAAKKNISPSWFNLNHKIKVRLVLRYADLGDIEADCIFATGIHTVEEVYRLPDRYGKKYYFIQGFENWTVSDDFVKQSYKLGMRNITVAKWLKNIVDYESGENTKYIPNAIDLNQFYLINGNVNRDRYRLSVMYSSAETKGFKYAYKSICQIKKKYPSVTVNMFGIERPAMEFAEWIEYTENPSVEELLKIYNSSSIYICASINEGFGLTALESMACGCALVASKYEGVFEYAIHEENALLSDVKDIKAMTDNIVRLLENDELRKTLAINGMVCAQQFTWDKAYSKLLDVIDN